MFIYTIQIMPDCLYNVTLYAILYSIGIRAPTVLQNAERNSVKNIFNVQNEREATVLENI